MFFFKLKYGTEIIQYVGLAYKTNIGDQSLQFKL